MSVGHHGSRAPKATGVTRAAPPGVKSADRKADDSGVTDQRCPQCSALVRDGAQWCSLCHHDLRPPAPPEPVVEAGEPAAASAPPVETPPAVSAARSPSAQAVPTDSGLHGRHARRAADTTVHDDETFAVLLAELQAVEGLPVTVSPETVALPPIRYDADGKPVVPDEWMEALRHTPDRRMERWNTLLENKGAKVAVAFGGFAAVAVVGFLVLSIIGLVLR